MLTYLTVGLGYWPQYKLSLTVSLSFAYFDCVCVCVCGLSERAHVYFAWSVYARVCLYLRRVCKFFVRLRARV